MSAYVIVEIDIHDKEMYTEYQKLTPATIAAYGGKFIVRGGQTATLEGEWHPKRLVVVEFESVTKAQEWWDSPGYTEAKNIRQKCADTKMIIVEGV
jgi:uncharacterized protein (DUF1330 family)